MESNIATCADRVALLLCHQDIELKTESVKDFFVACAEYFECHGLDKDVAQAQAQTCSSHLIMRIVEFESRMGRA